MKKEAIPTEINRGDKVIITEEDGSGEKRIVVEVIQISKGKYRLILAGDGIPNLTFNDGKWQYTDSRGLQTTVRLNLCK